MHFKFVAEVSKNTIKTLKNDEKLVPQPKYFKRHILDMLHKVKQLELCYKEPVRL